ncbi:MAG TPA: site-2 protease family protein [Blastocatellia bacterium]|nr:site-2 protease family protein [Blastocatellia bacterium]
MEKVNFGNLIIYLIALIFSLSFHEAAHAWTSEKFGDDTGRLEGRITLNPLPHIDPIGTLLFPIIGFFSNFPLLGFAKPVNTNPLRWRDKTKANIWVSAAGPISNFILAIVAFIIIKVLVLNQAMMLFGGDEFSIVIPAVSGDQSTYLEPLAKLISIMLILNVSLGVFNFIPIPPLDGSHVLESVLPYEQAQAFAQFRPYGMILLYALLLLGVFRYIINPVFTLVFALL